MMNVDLMMMMMVVVVMENDDVIDYHCVNHDDDLDHGHDLVHDHDHDLLNVDFVVDIVSLLHDDHKNIDPNIDKIHDEDNNDMEVFFKIKEKNKNK